MSDSQRTSSVWPKPDVSEVVESISQVETSVKEDELTQKEINLELLRQLRLLNARIEEGFATGINENDVDGEL